MVVFQSILKMGFFFSKWLRPFFNLLPSSFRQKISYFIRAQSKNLLNKSKFIKIKSADHANGKMGVNLIGYPHSTSGLGQLLKSTANSLEDSHLSYSCVDFSFSSFQKQSDTENDSILKEYIYRNNIFCLNGDGLITSLAGEGAKACDQRYNIQYAAWELEVYPKEWLVLDQYIHEYWAISEFTKKSLAAATSVPCYAMGIPVDFKQPLKYSKEYFNLPKSKFLYFTIFDMNSVVDRKNPFAVLRAFIQSFEKNNKNVGLVLKVSRSKGRSEQNKLFNQLKKMSEDHPHIYIVDGLLPRDEVLDLMNHCDVVVSLHRSEGFGLGLAEGMKMGKLTIATGYSGNLDFMNHNNSLLVDYSLIPVKHGSYPYGEGQVWAEPDEKDAIEKFKIAYENKELYKKLSIQAKSDIDRNYSYEYFSRKIEARLNSMAGLE